ncbi:MAG: O-methyltransferase [Candidatus Gastranaerophilales bacterium]|nr:O-methyltransferase [Candidatus Gastranaerophilales bacterium]
MNVIEDTLKELEATKNDFWNISKETGDFIEFLIKVSKAQNVLELGTSNGYSGLRIALALKETGGHLTTVEYWEKRRSVAVENFKKCGVDDIITAKLGSAQMVIEEELQNETFDFVFIDANKAGYIKFFHAVHPLLKKGGIIVADDVLSHCEQVKPFVDEITNRDDYSAQILNLPDGVLIARKNF